MAITYVDALNTVIPMVDGEVAEILEALAEADEPMTCGEITKALEGDYTSQKISALLRQLVAGGKVTKSTEKKVSRFELA